MTWMIFERHESFEWNSTKHFDANRIKLAPFEHCFNDLAHLGNFCRNFQKWQLEPMWVSYHSEYALLVLLQVMPYPEDVVRCHAVIQAWNIEVCHCVYANKTYTIERDDKQWAKDMAECRKFLDTEGFWKTPFRTIDPENSRKKNL